MAGNTHEVKIVINGDNSGAVSKLTSVKSLLDGGIIGALNGVRNAVGKVMSAFGVFGLAVNGVNMLIDAYKKIQTWLHRAETAARELREEIEKTSYANAVAQASASYENLNKRLSETVRLEKERNDILAERKSVERDVEDAELERNKQIEISSVDPNAKDYAEKKKEIERKYEVISSDRMAARADEDVRSKAGDLYRSADAKDQEANAIEKELRKHEAILERAVEMNFKAGMDARGGDEKAVEKAKETEKAFQEAFDKAKKIREEMEKARAEAQSIREKAAEATGGNVAARLRNDANKQRIDNESKAEAADKRKKEEEEAKADADKLLQRKQDLEDKTLGRKMQEDLAGLDPNDPNYAAKKREIEETYELRAAQDKRDRAKTPEERAAAEEELQAISIRQKREQMERDAESRGGYEDRMLGQVDSSRPRNRLTAMGLGSGTAVDRTAQQQAENVKTLVQLLKEQVTLTRMGGQSNASVYAP